MQRPFRVDGAQIREGGEPGSGRGEEREEQAARPGTRPVRPPCPCRFSPFLVHFMMMMMMMMMFI